MTVRVTTRKAWPAIVKREPFTTSGALRAEDANGGGAWPLGQLPEQWRKAAQYRSVEYVVYSYNTPIAWFDTVHGWIMPDIRYSVTTSRHQSQVRHAGIDYTTSLFANVDRDA